MQLYIHLPFCKSKCQYCDFNSCANVDEGTVFSYLSALNTEIKLAAEVYGKADIDTVYIGGGTPSLLEPNKIQSICRVLASNFDLSEIREFTIECNPESIDENKLSVYKACGIDRISIGIQSLCDANLKSMGRLHNSKTAIEKLTLARKYYDNVSCDIIVGLPYDTVDIVKNEINTLAPLVRHISVYALTVEEDTPLAKRVEDGRVLLPDEDEVADFLTIAEDELNKHGLKKYEISNFSVEGKESRHNLGYWTDAEYIGIGAGAHSYIKTKDGTQPLNAGIRFAHPKDINAYIAGINCAGSFDNIPRAEMSVLSEKDIFNERIMLGLRTVRGVESELLAGRIPDELKCYFKEKNGYISLTKSGMAVMNSILVRIMQF